MICKDKMKFKILTQEIKFLILNKLSSIFNGKFRNKIIIKFNNKQYKKIKIFKLYKLTNHK